MTDWRHSRRTPRLALSAVVAACFIAAAWWLRESASTLIIIAALLVAAASFARLLLALRDNVRLLQQLERDGLARSAMLKAQSELGETLLVIEGSRLIDANAAAEDLTGYTIDEMKSMSSIFELVIPERREDALSWLRDAVRGRPVSKRYETTIQHKNGSHVQSEAAVSPFEVAGRRFTLLVARDVSARTRAEEELRASERMSQAVIAALPDAVYRYDGDGTCLFAKIDGGADSGLPADTIVGLNLADFATPAFAEQAIALIRRTLETGEMQSFEYTSADTQHDFEGRMTVSGANEVVVVTRDITEQKRSQAALRASEERHRGLFEHANDIIYAHDMSGRFTSLNPAITRLYGYTLDEALTLNIADVVDAEHMDLAVEKMFGGANDNNEVEPFELLTRAKDGSPVWLEVSARVVLRGNEMIAIEGIGRNITERKAAEQALRESEERLRVVIENAPVITFALDSRGIYSLTAGRGLSRLGLTPDEVIGRSVFDVFAQVPVAQDMARRALAGEQSSEVITLRNVTLEIYCVPIFDGRGAVAQVIGVAIDISERVHAESELQEHAERLQESNRNLAETLSTLAISKSQLEEKSLLLQYALDAEREHARRDSLTGMLNHGAIMEVLQELIGNAEAQCAVAMIDVDGMKATNDTFGHQVGDLVLIEGAGALARDGAIIGRYGGDEFVALLPGAGRKAAEEYRDSVLASLDSAFIVDPESGARIPVVLSIGLATYPQEAANIDDLVKLADSAMYAAKRERAHDATLSGRAQPDQRAARMVGELVPLLTSPGDLGEKLNLVSRKLSVGAGYDAVNFLLSQAGPRQVNVFARMREQDTSAWAAEQERHTGDHPVREILIRTRRPLIMHDLEHDAGITEKQRRMLLTTGLRSALVAPMFWRDELVGILSVASKRENAFGPADAAFLMSVATQVTAIVRMSTLVEELQSATQRLAASQAETVMMLAAAAEAHDRTTGLHLMSIRTLVESLARELGYDEQRVADLGLAAVLHDIGKVSVPDAVLSSAGKLLGDDWEQMKQHTIWGGDFLSGRPGFDLASSVARWHHERWDGGGYPDGLHDDEIPEEATIVTVADSFDAMTHDRPYKAGRSMDLAIEEIKACSGTQFSPRVVDALVRLYERGEIMVTEDDDHHGHDHPDQLEAA